MKFIFNNSSVTINVSTQESEKAITAECLEQGNTFTLTNEEKYVLQCILYHVKFNDATRSLLYKLVNGTDELCATDWNKVVFEKDVLGDTVINFVGEEYL